MIRRSGVVLVLVLCLGLVLSGCPKKTVMKDEPAVRRSGETARREKEKEESRIREDAAKREREKEEARIKEDAAKREREKEFEKSLTEKRQPGIEGKVLESALLKDIHFDFDRYDIQSRDVAVMKENAALLAKYPGVKIQIEGHCDERGTAEYNLALGERRANSAKKHLVSLGIPENRLSTISYGEEKPLDSSSHEEAWSKNRRAHSIILSK